MVRLITSIPRTEKETDVIPPKERALADGEIPECTTVESHHPSFISGEAPKWLS